MRGNMIYGTGKFLPKIKREYQCGGTAHVEEVGEIKISETGKVDLLKPAQQSTDFVRTYEVKGNDGVESVFTHTKKGKNETCTENNEYGVFELDPEMCRNLRTIFPCE